MSKYSVDFTKLVADILPPKKRTPNRIKFIYILLKWIRKIHAEFITLQSDLETKSKINSQVIIFESYLVDLFGAGITITVNEIVQNLAIIYSSSDNSLGASVISSGQSSGGNVVNAYNDNSLSVNFIVNVPIALEADISRLTAIINKYKAPGSTYQIIES